MFDILTIGSATRDVFLESPSFRVLRDPEHLSRIGFPTGEAECFALGSKIEISNVDFALGGGAANAAVTFARGGLKTAALVRVGNDSAGRDIVSNLKHEKVRTQAIVDKKHGTAYATILKAPNGERTVLIYRGASEQLSKNELSQQVVASKWIYVVPGSINPSVLIPFLIRARKSGTKIAVNPSRFYLSLPRKKLLKLLSISDVVISNREEASLMTEVPYHETNHIFKKFDELIPGIAVLTDGSRGVHVSDGKSVWSAGIFKQRLVVDRTGAGDAFGSAFVGALIRGASIPEAMRRGSANATSVIERIGAEAGILSRELYSAPRWKKLLVSENHLNS